MIYRWSTGHCASDGVLGVFIACRRQVEICVVSHSLHLFAPISWTWKKGTQRQHQFSCVDNQDSTSLVVLTITEFRFFFSSFKFSSFIQRKPQLKTSSCCREIGQRTKNWMWTGCLPMNFISGTLRVISQQLLRYSRSSFRQLYRSSSLGLSF